MTTVSAVIPAYRSGAFLERAVRSVLAQSAEVHQIFIVDDCSPDDTFDVACSLRELDPRVVALQTPRNGGPGPARQRGIDAAATPLIAFLDADDEWHPTHLSRALQVLDSRADVVCTWASWETVPSGSPWDSLPDVEIAEEFDTWALLVQSPVVQSGAVARRETILAVDGFYADVRWCEDFCLWIRLNTAGVIAKLSGTSVRRHDHDAQISRQIGNMAAGRWQALQRFEAWGPKRWSQWSDERFSAAAQSAVDADVFHARANRSDEWLNAILLEAAKLTACQPRVRKWEVWRQRHWPVERALMRAYDSLPVAIRSALRRVRSA
jgi:glycosyltransferase involved in cell wall biosynthesis